MLRWLVGGCTGNFVTFSVFGDFYGTGMEFWCSGVILRISVIFRCWVECWCSGGILPISENVRCRVKFFALGKDFGDYFRFTGVEWIFRLCRSVGGPARNFSTRLEVLDFAVLDANFEQLYEFSVWVTG